MMFSEYFQVGDLVYASADLLSDGHVPDTADGDMLVPKHTRGMVVEIGHVESRPDTNIYLVRFEGADRELGPALGCLKEELTQRV
jgi:hypothetical protein